MHITIRRLWGGVLTAGLIGAVAVAGQPAAGAHSGPVSRSAAPVLDWSAFGTQAIVAPPNPASPNLRGSASSLVLEGILHITIYDTVEALVPGRARPYVAHVPERPGASAAAAVATAVHHVLATRIPTQQGFLDTTYNTYLDGVGEGRAKQEGIALGAQVAEEILAWRANDGFGATPRWQQPMPGPGVWEPSIAGAPPGDLILTEVRPLSLRSRDQFRPGPPPALESDRYAEDFDEVKRFGRADSQDRSTLQTETARFWSEQTGQQLNRALRQLAVARNLDLLGTARMLAVAHLSGADAALACWDAKYYYNLWRPFHAVPRADTDRNPATTADQTWTPLINLSFPEYPSGHACVSGAITRAVAWYFGTHNVSMTINSLAAGAGPARTYPNLAAVRADVAEARILSGLHFRFSMEVGDRLGARVARWVTARFPGC